MCEHTFAYEVWDSVKLAYKVRYSEQTPEIRISEAPPRLQRTVISHLREETRSMFVSRPNNITRKVWHFLLLNSTRPYAINSTKPS